MRPRSLPLSPDPPRSPFRSSAPAFVLASGHGAAAAIWVVAGQHLPGGRWLAVHLLTLGVLSNLILTFSQHFAHTVTRAPGDAPRRDTLLLNAGILPILIGVATGRAWLLAGGATLASAAVVIAYRRLRRLRREAVGARFGWVVRVYERAHGAFLHGAVLGALLGAGVLPGPWHGTARLAHLHVNVLGWAGLTLLATLVFFGPTMIRTRIEDGADRRASRVLGAAATALTVAVLALLASGVGGAAGTALRITAGAALAAFAGAATAVVVPVAVAAARGRRGGIQVHLLAICLWTGGALWADAAVVVLGAWAWLDAVGLAVLLGVLLQAALATLTYLAPMLRGRTATARDELLARLERRSSGRAVAYNAAVLAAVLAVVLARAGGDGSLLARSGWIVVLAVAAHLATAVLRRTQQVDAGTGAPSRADRPDGP